MNKRVIQIIPSVIFYIIAGLLAVYAVWSYTFCSEVIAQAKASGQLATSGNGYDVASFYMGNCGQYIVFALLLVAAGLLLQRKPSAPSGARADIGAAERAKMDDELDEWFSEQGLAE